MITFTGWAGLLFTLLLKVSASGALAALLVRSSTFRKVLYTEIRDSDLKVKLMLFLTPPLAIGIILRLVGVGGTYRFADLMLEGSFLLGLLGGRVVGPIGGAIVSLPAFVHHEWLSAPVAASVGLVGGLVRQAMPNKEDIWSFGPFTFLNIPKSLVRLVRKRKVPWEMLPPTVCALLEVARLLLGHATHARWLFYLDGEGIWQNLLILFGTTMSVAVAIKIWNNTRIEMNLEQHQRLLLKARMDALSSQINPHFLFNTLNTVSSLIRYRSGYGAHRGHQAQQYFAEAVAQARDVCAVARRTRLLSTTIWISRWCGSAATIYRSTRMWRSRRWRPSCPACCCSPSWKIPLKHGLSGKIEGGHIHIRTSLSDGRLLIEVADNGVGIPEGRLPQVYVDGIGISNVHERLKVLYGGDFRMEINSREGEGTRILIDVPEVVPTFPAATLN